ncbi:sigma-70 family RNA polymerase sigma factor [Novosphingobium colocasiae]
MSKITAALEAAVSTVQSNMPTDAAQTRRQRAEIDRAFARILKLIAPRIRHFIRQYGLAGHWEDAEQCCAIAVHRAILAYEPEKAQFTTFVNWQIRGELQSLRFRVMTDQRPSARKVEATTVSLDAITGGADGEGLSILAAIADEDALDRTEAGASDYLARSAMRALTDTYVEHLRNAGLDRINRRAQPRKLTRAERAAGAVAVPQPPVDTSEVSELEERIEHNRQVVQGRLFDIAPLDLGDDEIHPRTHAPDRQARGQDHRRPRHPRPPASH